VIAVIVKNEALFLFGSMIWLFCARRRKLTQVDCAFRSRAITRDGGDPPIFFPISVVGFVFNVKSNQ